MARPNITFEQRMRLPLIVAVCLSAALLLAAAGFAFEPWKHGAAGQAPDPKNSVQEYSWDELSAIGTELTACTSEQEAYSVGARFGLCSADGSVDATARKPVELADGTTVDAALAGVWHDERTDGGKAGLSFVFAAAPDAHAMNHAFENPQGLDADSVGGWAASDMRAWLNGSFFELLPSDLRAGIVSVEKRSASAVGSRAETAETGHLAGSNAEWTASASDRLWLLSVAELCGDVPARDDLDIDATMSQVYASEGSQYRLFADAGCEAFAPNPSLERMPCSTDSSEPCTWWLRTKTLEFGEGFWFVGTDGAILNGVGEDARALEDAAPEASLAYWGPDHARGVVAGFCL